MRRSRRCASHEPKTTAPLIVNAPPTTNPAKKAIEPTHRRRRRTCRPGRIGAAQSRRISWVGRPVVPSTTVIVGTALASLKARSTSDLKRSMLVARVGRRSAGQTARLPAVQGGDVVVAPERVQSPWRVPARPARSVIAWARASTLCPVDSAWAA